MDALARFNVQERYDLPNGQNESLQFSGIGLYSGSPVYRETAITAEIAILAVCKCHSGF